MVWFCLSGAPDTAPAIRDPIKGVDVQLTSSPRRALGLLAAGTIGLSTALLGLTGVAQAAAVPNAPTIDAVEGQDSSLLVFLKANNPDDTDTTTPRADKWEYSLDGGTTPLPTTDAGFTNGYSAVFLIDGLTNGDTYSVSIRGVSEGADDTVTTDDVPGDWSDPVEGTPFVPWGAAPAPTVTLGNGTMTIAWTAPTEQGTYPLAGYQARAYVSLPDGNGGSTDLCAADASTLTCTTKVYPGWKYAVFVNAIDTQDNQGGEGEKAALVTIPSVTTPATVPTKNGDLTLPAGAKAAVAAGKTITVSGSGYAPNSTVSVAIYSTPQVLTTVVTDASGNFTATVTVPAGLEVGNHTLVASGVDSSGNVRYVNLPVTVSSTTGKAMLAYTGADVALPLTAGLVALSLGGGLIVVRRRAARSAA